MKKLVSLLEAILLMVMAFPLTALAGQEGTQIISPVFCIPFAGLLLCVAITASCKGRMVGKPPASCSGILVPFIYHSICSDFLWRRRSGRNSA